jgi:hypothetical protein
MLDNISVKIGDLEKYVPDIQEKLFVEQVNFEEVIDEQKRKVYGFVKENYKANYNVNDNLSLVSTYGTSDELDTKLLDIKDYPQEQYLKNKIARLAIAEIYRQNRMYDDMQIWEDEANKVPIKYYIDVDDSGTVGYDEEVSARRYPTFHR